LISYKDRKEKETVWVQGPTKRKILLSVRKTGWDEGICQENEG
jgi:hypothetical protein